MRHSTVHYRGSSSGLVYNSYIPKVNPVAVGRCPAVVWAMSRGAFGVYFDSWPLTFLHAMSYGRGNEQARLNLRCWAFWKTHGVTSPSPNSLLVSASCLRLFPFTFKCLVALVGVLRLTLSTFVSPFFSVHFSPSACAFVFLLSPFTSLLFCSSIYRIRLLFWLSLSILPQLIDICLRFVPNYLPIGLFLLLASCGLGQRILVLIHLSPKSSLLVSSLLLGSRWLAWWISAYFCSYLLLLP